jgi:hypothetical protein
MRSRRPPDEPEVVKRQVRGVIESVLNGSLETVCAKMQVLQAGAGFHASACPTIYGPEAPSRTPTHSPGPCYSPAFSKRANSTSTVLSDGARSPARLYGVAPPRGVEASWLISSSLRPPRRAGVLVCPAITNPGPLLAVLWAVWGLPIGNARAREGEAVGRSKRRPWSPRIPPLA